MPATIEELVDIEDIINAENQSQRLIRDEIVPRVRNKLVDISNNDKELNLNSFVPGIHCIFIKTWGCSHNNSDGEYMAGLLAANGYKIVNKEDDADLIILNSCTVKSPSEEHFKNSIKSALSKNKFIVVAGCVPQAAPRSQYIKDYSVIGVQQIDRVVEVVEETLKGNKVRLFGTKKINRKKTGGARLSLPKIRRNPIIEIIPISTGCLNNCTYCKTKHARGDLGSYYIEEIVARAQEAINDGVKEIWLTSEDTGAYGKDIGSSLPELMYALIDIVPNDCRIRLGMTNPPYIKEHLDDMAIILSNPKVYSFLHIPVQSGSDMVLGDMKREYFINEFEYIVEFLRDKIPGINIATDIICGFPTETDNDFMKTIKLVEKYKFQSLFINQFYPRYGTPAAKMKNVSSSKEIKQRTRRLTELFESYKPYEGRVGRIEYALFTEESKDKKHYVGHNKFYEQILVPMEKDILGKILKVEIVSTARHYMMGRVIYNSNILNFFSQKATFFIFGLFITHLIIKIYRKR